MVGGPSGTIVALVTLAVVLVFAVARPHGWPEAVVAAPAAVLLIVAGVIPIHAAADEVGRLLPVVGFLAAVLVLARLCDDEGVFRAAGAWMARSSAQNPKRLLPFVFGVSAATTAILSLDTTVVLLTPVVLATVRMLGVSARPHAYAVAHLANSASLLLPVSNLTNLLAFTTAGLSFVHFAALMALPWLAAVAVEFTMLRWVFRRELSEPPVAAVAQEQPPVPVFALAVLALTLAGFVITSTLGLSPAMAALCGVLALAARRLRRGTLGNLVAAADVPFLMFVLCLGVVVDAVMVNGLDDTMRGLLPTGDGLAVLLGIAAVAALLANLVNNLPAVLVLLPLVASSGPAAVLAVLIGVNIGPNLTYPGSLSNLLWRNIVRSHDVPAGFLQFTRVGLWTTPVTLVVSVSALWLGLEVIGV